MRKIGIITDSACDLDRSEFAEFTRVLPLKILFSDGEYKDGVTITPDETYARMATEIPKTSLPDGEDIVRSLDELKAMGCTDVIAVMISSGLSGTYNAFVNIANDYHDLNIVAIDTKNLSMAEGALVLYTQELVKMGLNLDEILEKMEIRRKEIQTYFVLDTLEYLIKGGRIGKVSGTIGQLLNIKPIIHVNTDGIYHSVDKARGKKLAVAKLIGILKEQYLSQDDYNVFVMHGGTLSEAKEMQEAVKNLKGVNSTQIRQITPSLAVHTGPGLVGLIIEKVKKDS